MISFTKEETESDGSCRVGYLDNILHSSDYMLALVDTLMEYHRMDEGGDVYKRQPMWYCLSPNLSIPFVVDIGIQDIPLLWYN